MSVWVDTAKIYEMVSAKACKISGEQNECRGNSIIGYIFYMLFPEGES